MNFKYPAIMALWIFFALLTPAVSQADDGMPPAILNLIQNGQNVNMSIQIIDKGTIDTGVPGFDFSYALKRKGSAEDVVVFENKKFLQEDATLVEPPFCHWGESIYYLCDNYPEECKDCDKDGYGECFGNCVENTDTKKLECVMDRCSYFDCKDDCDGDGVNDCYGYCATQYKFEVTDHCVPPGDYGYVLYYYSADSGLLQDLDFENFTVIDSGSECTTATSDSACSITTVGAFSFTLLQLLLSL